MSKLLRKLSDKWCYFKLAALSYLAYKLGELCGASPEEQDGLANLNNYYNRRLHGQYHETAY